MEEQLIKVVTNVKTPKNRETSKINGMPSPSTITPDSSVPLTEVCKVKSILSLLKEIQKEYSILSELIIDTGFTGVEDNFRLREKLNDIIHQIRRTQDFVIKVKTKSKKSNQQDVSR
jgi:hypothetical protein